MYDQITSAQTAPDTDAPVARKPFVAPEVKEMGAMQNLTQLQGLTLQP